MQIRFYFSTTLGITNVTETPAGTPPTPPAVPAGTPANLVFSAVGQDTLTLSFDPVANASTYKVERGASATGPWAQVAQPATNSFADRALTASTTYYYRVKASNPGGDAASYSVVASRATTAAVPAGAISWTGSFTPGTTTLTCASCHGNPPLGTHPTGANACSTCHVGFADNTTNPQTVDKTLHMNGIVNVDCVGCHSSSQGTRREVVSEFSGTWSHKRSSGRTVNKWDCIVCHMEGNTSDGERSGVHADGVINLRDPDTGNNIQGVTFSNAVGGNAAGSYSPTGTAFTFASFSRNLSVPLDSDPSRAAIQAIMVNQCLKCHDNNGAQAFAGTNPLSSFATNHPTGTTRSASIPFGTAISYSGIAANIGGTATVPSGAGVTANSTAGGVIDVNESFKATNSSYHPVAGRQNNAFAYGTRMATPWNSGVTGRTAATPNLNVYGFLISCWDCHAPDGTASTVTLTKTVTAHGGASTVRGRPTVQTPGGNAASGTNEANLCKLCHALYDTNTGNNHGTGSAFSSSTNSGMTVFVRYGCNACHSSNYNTAAIRPIRGADVHGVNALLTGSIASSGRWSGSATGCTNTVGGGTCTAASVDRRPYAFMRNTNILQNHQPKVGGANTWSGASCAATGNTSPCDDNMGGYTAGGTY